jgi:hypothetical protein
MMAPFYNQRLSHMKYLSLIVDFYFLRNEPNFCLQFQSFIFLRSEISPRREGAVGECWPPFGEAGVEFIDQNGGGGAASKAVKGEIRKIGGLPSRVEAINIH